MFIPFVMVVVISAHMMWCDAKLCSREKAKLVRKQIVQELQPIFQDHHVTVSLKCPFSEARDMYARQEALKRKESSSKWVCDACGKAFIAEGYLDDHFNNRHPDLAKQENSVCLADYCDIFRCDILTGHQKPDYWQMALCREEELRQVYEKCQNVMKLCVPENMPTKDEDELYASLLTNVCSYLTCKKYWELPKTQLHPVSILTYVYLSLCLFTLLGIYYYVAYSQYKSGESMAHYFKRIEDDHRPVLHPPGEHDIRHRGAAPPRR